jgi:hypothetical protein
MTPLGILFLTVEFHRGPQGQIMSRQGIDLDRSALADWVGQSARSGL